MGSGKEKEVSIVKKDGQSYDPSTMCLKPFGHIASNPEGYLLACCEASRFNVHLDDQSFEQTFNHEEVLKLREDLWNGRKNPICATCWKKESLGLVSSRENEFTKSYHKGKSYVVNSDYTMEPLIHSMDIRFSNMCNYECRMCNHVYSSKWFKKAKEIGYGHAMFKGKLAEKAFVSVRKDLLDDIKPYLNDKLAWVYFAGAEPLIMPEHSHLLSYFIDNDLDPTLTYNTNLHTLNYEKFNFDVLWSKFSNVSLLLSLDGIFEVGAYQRVGFDHDNFFNNLDKLKPQFNPINSQQYHSHQYSFQVTVTPFNALHLFDMYYWLLDNGYVQDFDAMFYSMSVGPGFLNLNNLREDSKSMLKDNWLSNMSKIEDKRILADFAAFIKLLEAPVDDNWYAQETNDLYNSVIKQDKFHNTSYKDITDLRWAENIHTQH